MITELNPLEKRAAASYDAALVAELRSLCEMVQLSTALAEGGALDSFAQHIQQSQKNPFLAAVSAMRGMEVVLLDQIAKLVKGFLLEKQQLIKAVYKTTRQGNVLEYVLVLSDYSLDSQFELDEFSSLYEQTGLNDRIPVVMHYIPQELVSELVNVELFDLKSA